MLFFCRVEIVHELICFLLGDGSEKYSMDNYDIWGLCFQWWVQYLSQTARTVQVSEVRTLRKIQSQDGLTQHQLDDVLVWPGQKKCRRMMLSRWHRTGLPKPDVLSRLDLNSWFLWDIHKHLSRFSCNKLFLISHVGRCWEHFGCVLILVVPSLFVVFIHV